MKNWHLFPVLTLAFLAGCGGDSSKAIVTVDGEEVSYEEFHQHLQTKQTVRVIVQGQIVELPVSETMAFQALQDMVSRTVIVQMAMDENLVPTEEEIEQEINFQKAINPSFLDNRKALGFTMGQIRETIKAELCQYRLFTKGIEVPIEEVKELIEQNPDQFVNPARADVYFIYVLNEAEKSEVDTALASAQKFKAVAAQYSRAAQASQTNGRFPVQALNSMDLVVREVVEATAIGGTSDWVDYNAGFAKFYVESKTEAAPIDMTDERMEYVRRQIALGRGKAANDLPQRVAKRIREANIKITEDDPNLEQLWDQYIERLKQGDVSPLDTTDTSNPEATE